MKKQKRRYATVDIPDRLEIARARLVIRGYVPSGSFVCRLEISGAGIDVFGGDKGGARLYSVLWERLVEDLKKLKNM